MTKYMILDKDNITINVISFADDHNEDLQQFLSTIPEGERILEVNENELFGVGLKYNDEFQKVMPEQPYPSWIWDEVEWIWICPIPVPENVENYRYIWDEENMQWKLVEIN